MVSNEKCISSKVTSTITGEVSLGPNVIIGSAAFNLTVVLAACILAVPAGEIRKVVHRDSYVVLTVFAFLGPAWLLLILRATSPHVVRVFEAILTFLYFPWLVMLVFFADKGNYTRTRYYRYVHSLRGCRFLFTDCTL